MPYSTTADILKILPESEVLHLADDEDIGIVGASSVAAVLSEAIEQADREIDAHVGVVRAVPLDPVPALIANLSAKLAVHNLYLRRPGIVEPDSWQRETSRCLRLLEAIATGRLALGAQPGPSTPAPSWSAGERLMSRQTL